MQSVRPRAFSRELAVHGLPHAPCTVRPRSGRDRDELLVEHRVDGVLERDLVWLELEAEAALGARLDLARLARHARRDVHVAHRRDGQSGFLLGLSLRRRDASGLQDVQGIIEAFSELKRLPELQKKYVIDSINLLGKAIHPWQEEALMELWHLIERASDMNVAPFSFQVLDRKTAFAAAKSRLNAPEYHPDFDTPLGAGSRDSDGDPEAGRGDEIEITGPCAIPADMRASFQVREAMKHTLVKLDAELMARVNLLRRRDRMSFSERLNKALVSVLALRLEYSHGAHRLQGKGTHHKDEAKALAASACCSW